MGNALLGVEALGAELDEVGRFSLTGGLLIVGGRSLSVGTSSAAEQARRKVNANHPEEPAHPNTQRMSISSL